MQTAHPRCRPPRFDETSAHVLLSTQIGRPFCQDDEFRSLVRSGPRHGRPSGVLAELLGPHLRPCQRMAPTFLARPVETATMCGPDVQVDD